MRTLPGRPQFSLAYNSARADEMQMQCRRGGGKPYQARPAETTGSAPPAPSPPPFLFPSTVLHTRLSDLLLARARRGSLKFRIRPEAHGSTGMRSLRSEGDEGKLSERAF